MALIFTMRDGKTLVDDQESGGFADEVAFERQFKMPIAVVLVQETALRRWQVAVEAAKAVGAPEPQRPEETYIRSEHIVFFSWCRLRRADPASVPPTYDAFVEQVKDWDSVEDDVDSGTKQDGEIDATEAALIESGSGLDPTDQDRQLTSLPSSSSSPESTGTRS
jgi:hypothetical protein